jgi:hypothetical protein
VREVLDTGAKITDVAIRYPVDRWLVRYATAPSARFAIKLQAGSLSPADCAGDRGPDRVAEKGVGCEK